MHWDDAITYWNRVKLGVDPSAQNAADKMGKALKRGIRKQLNMFPHAEHTRTASPPGAPPGIITGELRDSVLSSAPMPMGNAVWQVEVGPHTVYARIQEEGGPMHAHNSPYMTWITDGKRYFRKYIDLPARPYMRPAVYRMTHDGEISFAARDGFAEVIYGFEDI